MKQGDLIKPISLIRLWDKSQIVDHGLFQKNEVGLIISGQDELDNNDFILVLTSKGRTGWVLKSLVRSTK